LSTFFAMAALPGAVATLPPADVAAAVAPVVDAAASLAADPTAAVGDAAAASAAAADSDAMVTQLATEVAAASAAPAVDAAVEAAAAAAAANANAEQAAPDEAAAAAAAVVAAAEPLHEAVAAEQAAAAAAAAPPPPAPPVAMEDTVAAEAAAAAAAAAAATAAAAAAASAMEEDTPAAVALPVDPAAAAAAAAAAVAAAAAAPPAAVAAPAVAAPVAVPAAPAAAPVAPVAAPVVVTPAKNSRDNPVDMSTRTPPPAILPGVITPGGGGRRTPRVITEHFCDVVVDGTGGSARLSAVCLHCGCTIRGSVAVTSNFIKHMERRHQAAHAAFLEAGGVKTKRVRRSSGASPGEAKKSRGRPPAGESAKAAAAAAEKARHSLGGSSGFGDTMDDHGAEMDTGMGYPAQSLSATHVNVLGMDAVLPSITCSRVRGVLAKQAAPLVSAHGVAAATGAHSVALKCDGALPGGRTQFRALVSLFVSAAASAAALAEAAGGVDGLSPTPASPHTPSATAAGLPLVPRGAGRKPVTVFAGATLGAEAASAAAALRLPCTVVLPTVADADAGGATRPAVVDAKTTRLAQVRAAGATILFRGLTDDAADAAADVLASASATPAVLADLSLPVSVAGQMNLMGDREKHLVGGYATAILEALTDGAGGDDADVDVVYVPARVACVVAAASVMRAVLPKASLVAVDVVVDKAAKAASVLNGSLYAYPIDEEVETAAAAAADGSRPSSASAIAGLAAPDGSTPVGGGRSERYGSLSAVEREFVDSLVSRIITVSPDQAVAAAAAVATAGRGACADAPGAVALAGILTDDAAHVRGARALAWITSAVDFAGALVVADAGIGSTAAGAARRALALAPGGVTLAVSVDGADQPSVLSQLLHRLRACGVVTSFRFARSSAILTTLAPGAGVTIEGSDGVLERLRRYGYVTADVSASRLIAPAAAGAEGADAGLASGVVDGFIGALPLAAPGEVVCLYRFERDAAASAGGAAGGTDGGSVRLLEEVLGEMRVGWKVVLAGGWGTSGALVGFVVLSTELEVVAQWATENGRGGVDESENAASAVLRGSG